KALSDDSYTFIDDPNIIEPGWKLCVPSAEQAEAELSVEPTPGGTAVIAINEDPGHFNPGITTGFNVHAVADSMFNGLVALDQNLNPEPDLAASWDISDDGTVYTFNLVPGVQWHDGAPFTSADVKYTFEEVLFNFHSRTKAGLGSVVQSIETPDEQTVVFTFTESYGPLLQRLDVTEAPILPKHIYEGTDPQEAPANLQPVGTGPFVFEEYVQGESVTLVKNENYFKPGLPYLDRLVFRLIPDDTTQLLALEEGEIDFVFRVPDPDVQRLRQLGTIDLVGSTTGAGGGNCIMTLTFNLEKEIFQDLRVRQAVAHAINRQQIVDQVLFGQGRVASAPISSGISFAHAAGVLNEYDYNPERAAQLLEEAGYPAGENGTRLTMDIIHFPQFNKYSEVMKQNLAEVGVELNVRPLDRAAAIDAIFGARDFDTNLISYCNGLDPDIGVRRMYVSDNIGNIPFSNGAAYVNERVDELFAEAGANANTAERSALYREVQQILADELPYWWLVESRFNSGYNANFNDFAVWTGQFAERAWLEQ
ncbi:MAG: ABC transporter substrate-binding protein, partial [Anaerolineae bacterium]|nr:ABC transporter substrate-binding protein [Anaerolineae bacterium]